MTSRPLATRPAPERLTELDWLRIAAFALLILYHVGMFYVPWDWHVKSPHPVPALESLMVLSAPWRMSLLFVVSGAATGLMLQRGGPLLRERSARLLLPLLFGMAVVVPAQPYLEVVEKLGYGGSFLDFLARYYAADHSFCRGRDCLELPTWNHLWFLPYLWVYTALLLALVRVRGRGWMDAAPWRRLTIGARLLWVPCLLFALERQQLVLAFPATHNLSWDWFNHALYGAMFLLGAVLFGQRDDVHGAWTAALRLRHWSLGLAVLLLAGMPQALEALGGFDALPGWGQSLWLALGGARHWLPVLAALGWAHTHLAGRDGPWRRRLTEAVFPCYLVHQTVIVVAAHHLARLGWPQPLEAATLVALTAAACAATVVLARHAGVLRPWLGLAPRRQDMSPAHGPGHGPGQGAGHSSGFSPDRPA
jgi:peptidoglycan/LPS O-acetylase OafA/YrhL